MATGAMLAETAEPPAPSTPAAAAASRRHLAFHPLRVADVERLTEEAVAVTFAVPEELRDEYRFEPGQHLNLRREVGGEEIRRSYSICAAPSSGRLRVAVKRLDGGAFSSYATTEMQVGDVVEVMTPAGRFGSAVVRERATSEAPGYCALAAGSGITPVLSILGHVLETQPTATFTLVYANRTSADVMFLEELEDLKDRYPTRFRLVHVLSREPQDVELFSGRLDSARLSRMLETILAPELVDDWFLCGPLAMVDDVRQTLLEHGVDGARIHAELFFADTPPPVAARRDTTTDAPSDATSTVTALLDGRTTRLTVPREGPSVLDALLAVRSDAPYACKGGVCGTCRAKLVDGEVRMERNWALEPDEIAAGTVLACQSRPVSEAVVLDFDA